jgi:hypothetical protein
MTSNTIKTNSGRLARKGLITSIAAALLAAPLSASAYDIKTGDKDTTFSIGGYAKLSAIYSSTDSGQIADTFGKAGREFYVPLTIPVGNAPSSKRLDLTARESRLNMKGKTTLGDHKVGMYLEMDFLTTTEGNEVATNSSAPRMRHYFFTFDNWLFGQTWTTFMDTSVLPEAVDFLGAVDGTVFIRQAQARYTMGDIQIALENPSNYVSGIDADERDYGSTLPDLTANLKLKVEGGHIRLNGLLRQISVEQATASNINDDAIGYGLGVTGKLKVGSSDDIRFSVHYGDGMGRYTSVALVNDAVIINNSLETVKSLAAFGAYRHVWDGKSSSNVILSMADIDNPNGSPGTLSKGASSITINYLYRPVKQVTYGIMFLAGERETENGDDGKLNRLQASAKYSF